jgi:hypothetical protein
MAHSPGSGGSSASDAVASTVGRALGDPPNQLCDPRRLRHGISYFTWLDGGTRILLAQPISSEIPSTLKFS